MQTNKLTILLVERVMGWRVGPERFWMSGRRWLARWRFQPTEKIEDALRLLKKAKPQKYSIEGDALGNIRVKVQIADTLGEACATSMALAVCQAIAKAMFGVEFK
jgi:hypothetical protein